MRFIRTSDDGQAIVEFVVMLPFILFMFLSIIEFGYGLYQQITVRNAASEAARYAAVGALPDGACGAGSIQERVITASNDLVTCGAPDTISVTYQDPSGGEYTRSSGVAVRIEHEHETITPLPALLNFISWGTVPTTWSLEACADARLESKPASQAGLVAGADCS